MSRAALVCLRNRDALADSEQTISRLRNLFSQPGTSVTGVQVVPRDGVTLITTDQRDDCSVQLGYREHDSADGSFAEVRQDGAHIKLITDAVGSRTIWFAQTEEVFLASTSQKALAVLLGDFQPDSRTLGWMLATGTLGPIGGWDRRVKPVPPASTLTFNRETWNVAIDTEPIEFEPREVSEETARQQLSAAMEETFERFPIAENWELPLSGGFDSRAILLQLIARGRKPRCLTWGKPGAQEINHSDAEIANRLAKHFDLEHRFVELHDESLDFAEIVERFLQAGEGRVDHIAGYMDGFRLWRSLAESGVRGVIRGDEGFGWEAVRTLTDARQSVGLTLFDDAPQNAWLAEWAKETCGPLALPDHLAHRQTESPAAWRDRLYHAFRIPVILAALNDLKAPFVEIAAPLLSLRILNVVRRLPDAMRTEKRLFAEIIEQQSPAIPFAKRGATESLSDILARSDVRDVIFDELHSQRAVDLFGTELAQRLRQTEVQPVRRSKWKTLARKLLPNAAIRRLRNKVGTGGIPRDRLVFRAFLAMRMHRDLAAPGER